MKLFQFQKIKADEKFEPSVLAANIPFTQANFYGNWQKSLGRTVKKFLIRNNKEIVAYCQLIKYPLPFGKNYLYAPYGPIIKTYSVELLNYIKEKLSIVASNEKSIFVRLDFTPPISDNILSAFFNKAPLYTYHSAHFQPRSELFLRLNKPDNELLAAMHEKARYSIRLSKRRGVTAKIITENFGRYFTVFYQLMEETADRNHFHLHSKKYYENIFHDLSKIKNAYLSIAEYNREILAINLIVVFSGIANYIFGGSSNQKRNYMPTYLAHWQAIRHAQNILCRYYNFGGISIKNINIYKEWNGLTAFKKKFGGQEIIHSNFFDLVAHPFWYRCYNSMKYLKSKL